jgi:MFS family permease
MIAQGLADALASPAVIAVLATVGFALLWLLARELRRIPAELMTLMATAFLDMFGLFLVLPLVPYYVKRMVGDGVDVAGITFDVGTVQGVVVSAFTVAQMLSAPLWGRFSDRFGRRPALLVALGASAIAYLIFGFADSLWLLLLSRVMQGAGGGTVGVIHAYVGDSAAPGSAGCRRRPTSVSRWDLRSASW